MSYELVMLCIGFITFGYMMHEIMSGCFGTWASMLVCEDFYSFSYG